VTDTPVRTALLFGTLRYKEATSLCEEHDLHAPTLLPDGLHNVAVTGIPKHPDQHKTILKSLSPGMDCGRLTLVELEDAPVVPPSRETDFPAGDTSFLLLSRRLNGQLLSFDQTLQKTENGHRRIWKFIRIRPVVCESARISSMPRSTYDRIRILHRQKSAPECS